MPQARDPKRRWYGVYANYNTPAYNTKMVKESDLPKSYEEFAERKEWAGKIAIDGTDTDWLNGHVHALRRGEGHVRSSSDIVGDAQAGADRRSSGARALGRRPASTVVALNNYVIADART